ncbi:hypothetical protein [Deinococcus petrolearius]|uniref:Uncharacterized protein n=1 Tax=Deinococcus petrolearius TaxID=1751295 RepID=A0ABW1DEF9_9DEIO
MSDKVMVSRQDLEAMRAGIVNWRMDHPHIADTDGLDRTERLLNAALAPAPASSEGGAVWAEVRIPVGRLRQQINDHQRYAQRASWRGGETTDPVITAYCQTVASLHMEFAGELLGLIPPALAPAPAGAE